MVTAFSLPSFEISVYFKLTTAKTARLNLDSQPTFNNHVISYLDINLLSITKEIDQLLSFTQIIQISSFMQS